MSPMPEHPQQLCPAFGCLCIRHKVGLPSRLSILQTFWDRLSNQNQKDDQINENVSGGDIVGRKTLHTTYLF